VPVLFSFFPFSFPGTIDLNDNRDTAIRLFDLVNVICDQMITHPKNVQDMYAKLPPEKLAAIAKRDEKGDRNN